MDWRIIKDWLDAQLALIQTHMVNAEEVFSPYQIMGKSGETVYEVTCGVIGCCRETKQVL